MLPNFLRQHIIWRLDDILIYSSTIANSFKSIVDFFTFCATYNFKLHPAKCIIFATSIRWCGRFISSNGVSFDQRRIAAICNMTSSQTGAYLQQFVCAMQAWHSRTLVGNKPFSASSREGLYPCQQTHTVGIRSNLALKQDGSRKMKMHSVVVKKILNTKSYWHMCIFLNASMYTQMFPTTFDWLSSR